MVQELGSVLVSYVASTCIGPFAHFPFSFLLTLSSCSSLAEFPAGRLKAVIELLIN